MSGNQKKYHAVLRKLKLVDNLKSIGTAESQPPVSPLDILNHLLETKVLTQQSVKAAVKSLLEENSTENTNGETQESKKETPDNVKKNVSQKHRTRHIALRFFYDGANFGGLAQNFGNEKDNSVEKALFQALLKANLVESRESSGFSRCGRTDKGVSAAGQVVALNIKSTIPQDASFDSDGKMLIANEDLPKNEFEKVKVWVYPKKNTGDTTSNIEKDMTEYPYTRILNNLLPPEIKILGWAPVSTDFSARFSATTRTYRYFFAKRQMDLDQIRQGLKLLVGKHDFRNLCKMDVEKVYRFERTIHTAELVQLSEEVCYFQILGQAFLWHQIRCIAKVLFMIGRGLESPEVITELQDVKKYPGKPSYPLAAEKPLVLHDCGYPNLHVGYSVNNIWAVSCQLEQQWEELTLAAARIRNGIESLLDVSVLKEDLINFATMKRTERGKKQRRAGTSEVEDAPTDLKLDVEDDDESTTIQWPKALSWLLVSHGLIPDSKGMNTPVHIPLLQRGMGTTYEEKIEGLMKSEKRRQKFEDNVIKKRKTKEEDSAFYQHMIKQGGAGM